MKKILIALITISLIGCNNTSTNTNTTSTPKPKEMTSEEYDKVIEHRNELDKRKLDILKEQLSLTAKDSDLLNKYVKLKSGIEADMNSDDSIIDAYQKKNSSPEVYKVLRKSRHLDS